MAMASSMASLNPTSLCSSSSSSSSSSSPAPRIIPSKKIPYLIPSLNLNQPSLRPSPSSSFCNAHSSKIPSLALKASRSGDGEGEYEVYEVEIVKPYGLKFAKGRDGGTYIDAIEPGGSADKTGKFTVGDRVIATSAVFGDDIWPSAEYGRTMYTIRQRMGPLFMKMEKRYGKMDSTGELSDKEILRQERNAGFITDRVREIQLKNAMLKKERKERRKMELREGLQMYKSGQYEEALEKFESVLGSKPDPNEAAVANYNVACCYSQLNQVEAGLSALEDAMKAGFEDYKRVRRDPDLANLRSSPNFEPMVKKYDESFINEGAINALKSLFGFNKK